MKSDPVQMYLDVVVRGALLRLCHWYMRDMPHQLGVSAWIHQHRSVCVYCELLPVWWHLRSMPDWLQCACDDDRRNKRGAVHSVRCELLHGRVWQLCRLSNFVHIACWLD